jgi:hypothetical protein
MPVILTGSHQIEALAYEASRRSPEASAAATGWLAQIVATGTLYDELAA